MRLGTLIHLKELLDEEIKTVGEQYDAHIAIIKQMDSKNFTSDAREAIVDETSSLATVLENLSKMSEEIDNTYIKIDTPPKPRDNRPF